MPSWALLGMTTVKGKVRERNNKTINKRNKLKLIKTMSIWKNEK
jgi:hypothetical protein